MRRRAFAGPLAGLVAAGLFAACGSADSGTPERPAEAQASPSRGQSAAGPSATPEASEPSSASHPSGGVRPNLLLIEADDMRADELRWMPRTRRLLASRGLSFANSFAPDPLCCPSRASLLTGQYSHNHGVLSHTEPYGFGAFDDSDTLATRLQGVGYRTALVGKYLNGYGEQPTVDGEDSLHYVPPGWTEWWAGSDHRWSPGDEFRGGTYAYFNLTSNVNGEIRTWPGDYSTEVMASQTLGLVRRFGEAAKKDRRPWFVWWNPVAPHHGRPVEPDDPGTTPRKDGFGVFWETPARPDWAKGRFDRQIQRGLGVPPRGWRRSDNDDKPAYLRSLPELTPAEERALATVSRQRAESLLALDREVARVLTGLRTSRQLGRTIVVFTSDNGYYLGEHLKRQGKINLHEPSIRVPMLVAGPDIPAGQRFDPVTTVDLSRTLAAWAGVSLADPDGVDLQPTIREGDTGWGRPVVLEGLMPEPAYLAAREDPRWGSDLDTVGIRLAGWKLVRYATGESELFDLARDPLELSSIAGPAGGMRARLEGLYRQYADCVGASCRAALPADLTVDPARNRALTRAQDERRRSFYR